MTSFACGDESSWYAHALFHCVSFFRPAGAYLSSSSSLRLTPWAGHSYAASRLYKLWMFYPDTEISAHRPLLTVSAYTGGWILSCNPSRIGHGLCRRVRG